MEEEKIVPPQVVGKKSGAVSEVILAGIAEAKALFAAAKQRLLDINRWKDISGPLSADFKLTDLQGNMLEGPPQVGNLIRINLPGPGTRKGAGYDWVYIEEIKEVESTENKDFIGIRVRPVAAPVSDEEASSHFYTDNATSSFIVERTGTKVEASEEGRNEIPNRETKNIFDKIRNTLVAIGASQGLAYPQWKALMDGVLGNK